MFVDIRVVKENMIYANRGIVKSEEVIPVQESIVVSDVQHEAPVKTEEARDATAGGLVNHSAPEDVRSHTCETSEATEVSNEY